MGRVFKPRFSYTKKDGTLVDKQTAAWYVEYTDATGRTVRRKAGFNREQAQDSLRKAESDVLAEKNGLPVQRIRDIALAELMKKFIAHLKPRVTHDYVATLQQRLEDVFKGTRAVYLRDLTPDAMDRFLVKLDDANLAPRTINYYLKAPKTMLNWAVRARIIPYNPLDCVTARPELEKRRVRRAMTEDEIPRFLAAALEGPMRRKLKVYQNRPRKDGTYKPADIPPELPAKMAERGQNNVLAYRLMLETGLRRNEAASVTWNDIDLEDGALTTRPSWEGNKNGREETLPLTPGLQDALRQWHLRRPGPTTNRVVRMTGNFLDGFYEDLVAAGIAKRVPLDDEGEPIPQDERGRAERKPVEWIIDTRDAAGRVLDLHALRHTFGTRLGATPGIDPKSVQTLMRHSDARLTFGVYVHSDKKRLQTAVSQLPAIKIAVTSESEDRAVGIAAS